MAGSNSDKPETQPHPSQPPSSTPTASAADTAQPELVAAIREMSNSIIGQAELLRNQINNSEVQRGLAELRQSTQIFKALAESAIVGSLTSPNAVRLDTAGAPATTNVDRPCGCKEAHRRPCSPEYKPSCCIQLYISKVRVVEGQRAGE